MKLVDVYEDLQINFLMFVLLIMIFGAIGIVLFDLKMREIIENNL